MNMIVEYITCNECKTPNYGICLKCGRCGRKFENGFMIDTGGTTVEEEDD